MPTLLENRVCPRCRRMLSEEAGSCPACKFSTSTTRVRFMGDDRLREFYEVATRAGVDPRATPVDIYEGEYTAYVAGSAAKKIKQFFFGEGICYEVDAVVEDVPATGAARPTNVTCALPELSKQATDLANKMRGRMKAVQRMPDGKSKIDITDTSGKTIATVLGDPKAQPQKQ